MSKEPSRRALARAAGLTLFGVMAGHLLLETGRDALFLASISATRLPWVYIGVAAAAMGCVWVQGQFARRTGVSALSPTMAASATVTGLFWAILPVAGVPGLYALYVWSGVAATIMVLQLYSVLGRLVTVRQAKVLYARVGIGAVLGALVGSGLANVVARELGDQALLLAAALGFAAASIPAATLPSPGTPDLRREPAVALQTWSNRPYAVHVIGLVVLSGMTLTLVDYLFKSAVAAAIPPAELGAAFASIYLALNLASLAFQSFVSERALRWLGITRALLVLPVLLSLGTVGLLVGAGVFAAYGLKAIDGVLKHTLDQTTMELLWVPMPDRVRSRVKALADTFGQRGAKAVASLAILLFTMLTPSPWPIYLLLLVLSAGWIALASTIRRPYLDVFRTTLNDYAVELRPSLPALDLASLESLVEALNSATDREVLAALDLLDMEGRGHLVPTLILHHPNHAVVRRALDLFTKEKRASMVPLVLRRMGHADPETHAAMVRACLAAGAPHEHFERWRTSECAATRATAVVALCALGDLDTASALQALRGIYADAPSITSLAVADALAISPPELFRACASELLDVRDPEVRKRTARAMVARADPASAPAAIRLLADPVSRDDARRALVRLGDAGLAALAEALADDTLSLEIRWQIPGTLTAFPHRPAAEVLLPHLNTVTDGTLEYRILRALEKLVTEGARVPEADLDTAIERTIEAARRYLGWRWVLERESAVRTDLQTEALGLLIRLLLGKEANAIERLVRLLGLGVAGDDFGRIYRGLASDSPQARASSAELLEHLAPSKYRDVVMALVEPRSEAGRLARLEAVAPLTRQTYPQVLQAISESTSTTMAALSDLQTRSVGAA